MNKNRAFWDVASDAYQLAHGGRLAETALAWGVWRVPESELKVLGDVTGRDILELGCGAAQWSIALAELGARVVGLDVSAAQLHHARRTSSALPLMLATAESVPLKRESFDIVFCDHGAMTFARPEKTVAEVARVLRPGGTFAFCMSTPLRDVCWDTDAGAVTPQLATEYFNLSAIDDGETISYQLPYGAWIRLFREHSLIVEDLIELQAPEVAETTFDDYVPHSWARRWPAEHIWKLKKTA